jgi:hypothetical protein
MSIVPFEDSRFSATPSRRSPGGLRIRARERMRNPSGDLKGILAMPSSAHPGQQSRFSALNIRDEVCQRNRSKTLAFSSCEKSFEREA